MVQSKTIESAKALPYLIESLILKHHAYFNCFCTRPEAIKLAPVIKEIEKYPELKGIVCITAQHKRCWIRC